MWYNVGGILNVSILNFGKGQKMKVAVIGSRNIEVKDVGVYLPSNVTELISGGARGVDTSVCRYAAAVGVPLIEILPDYARYGRSAPLRRNEEIVTRAELVIALWDGASRGTAHVIGLCRRLGKPIKVYILSPTPEIFKF